ncbi:MAG: carboxypeptidase-like regulatory domain-containing protein [Ignavibacteria bacterium]|nr:carboxypeptidase-like regulatory domain-containing protein [Ignavibacteria bacterium]
MKKSILLVIMFVLTTSILAIGKTTISGRVVDEKSFPVSGVSVSIAGASVTTDKNGNFAVKDAELPFAAIIYDASTNTTVYYDKISITNPNFILFGRQFGKNANTAYVNILVDSIPNSSRGIIKFISQNTSYCKEEEITSGESRKQIAVKWPEGERSINGMIIYLEKNGAAYTRFASRSVILYNDFFPQDIRITGFFSTANFNTSPLTVYLPAKEYASKGFTIWGDFLGYNRNSDMRIISEGFANVSADTYVPTMLPISFTLKVRAECFNGKGDGFVNYTYTYPGSVVNLTYETPPEIASPSNDFKSVTSKTIFSYTEGSGAGTFVVNFRCLYPESNVYVVTNSRELYMPGGSQAGIPKNANFVWNVSKYIPYFTVDDLVKPKQFNNEYSYQAISYSKTYTFKTMW